MKSWIKKFFRSALAIILVFGIFSGRLNIKRGGISLPTSQAKPAEILEHAQKLENITGKLLIFPGPFDYFQAVLGQTTSGLQIQTYEFTEKRIKNLFKDLLSKGVNVQLIMENNPYQSYTNSFEDIQSTFSGYSNFEIKSDKQMKTEYVHSKVDILDNSFLIKSANLTHASLFSNREYMFFSYNPDVLQSLKTIFAKDRAGERIQLTDIHPNLVVCNINCRVVIEDMLRNAQESIIIETQYINDAAIIDILSSQEKKLGDMKLLVADLDTNDMLQSYLPTVTRKFPKPYMHAKMILIDHQTLLLGSMNLSSNSLDKNREIGILLNDPTIISQFTSQFAKDRSTGK